MFKLNPYLKDFWREQKTVKVLYGGRASSKSHDAAGFLIFLAQKIKIRVCCARQFQNKIQESVYTLLKNKIEEGGFNHKFDLTQSTIECPSTGSEFLFYGLARNISEVKSLEGIDILYIEEAHNLTKEQWDILDATIRKQGSQIWIIFNPNFISDFVYQQFIINTPKNCLKKQINYDNNPFLSKTMIEKIEQKKFEDEKDFAHIYLGEPKEDNEKVIIKRSWVNAAIDAHIKLKIKPKGQKIIAFDVADDGEDSNATVYRHGSVVLDLDLWHASEDELIKSSKRAYTHALKHKALLRYDCIGVGAYVGSKVKEMNDGRKEKQKDCYVVKCEKFDANGSVVNGDKPYIENEENEEIILNSDFFSNKKAQAWWIVAQRFYKTYLAVENGEPFEEDEIISLSSNLENLEDLITELSTPKQDRDANGRVKVESKQDLKKRKVKSPNMADAIIMAFAPEETKSVGFFDFD